MALEIAYVRTHEAYDRCHVVRDDGTEDAYRFHAYGGALPHELVHYAVETAFELRRGLWGSVAAGLDLARANDHANRVGGKDKYRAAFGVGLEEIVYSEALTNVPWFGDVSDAACMAAIAEIAERLAITTPPTAAQVRQARALLHELRNRFAALGPRQALDLEFAVDASPVVSRTQEP